MSSANSERPPIYRRASTPKTAWQDEQNTTQETSQADLNRNVKTSRSGQLSGEQKNSRMNSGDSAEHVRLEVEENSARAAERKARTAEKTGRNHNAKDKNGHDGVVVVKNAQNGGSMEMKDHESTRGDHMCRGDACCDDWSLFTRVFKSKRFESDKLEVLYQRYVFRLNQKFMLWLTLLLVVLTIVLAVFAFTKIEPQTNEGMNLSVKGVILCVLLFLYFVLALIVNRSGSSQQQWGFNKWISYFLLGMSVAFVLVSTVTVQGAKTASTTDGVFVTIFFVYTTYTMLPVRMRIAVCGGCILPTIQLICSAAVNKNEENLWRLVSFIELFVHVWF